VCCRINYSRISAKLVVILLQYSLLVFTYTHVINEAWHK